MSLDSEEIRTASNDTLLSQMRLLQQQLRDTSIRLDDTEKWRHNLQSESMYTQRQQQTDQSEQFGLRGSVNHPQNPDAGAAAIGARDKR